MIRFHISSHKDVSNTFVASNSNEITKKYYYHCVGEIKRGTLISAVCEKYNTNFGISSYHLLTIP